MNGYSHRGEIKSFNQHRKNFTQMSKAEKVKLAKALNSINPSELHINDGIRGHLKEVRGKKIDFKNEDLLATIANPNVIYHIIEYNELAIPSQNKRVQRVLFKLMRPYLMTFNGRKAHVNVFFVLELSTNTIITAYGNLQTDTHNTINMALYDKDMVIPDVIPGGLPLFE